MDREGGNKEKIRKCRERISLHFLILSIFPHSLTISSSFSHSLSIISQPGCQAATICATLLDDQNDCSTWRLPVKQAPEIYRELLLGQTVLLLQCHKLLTLFLISSNTSSPCVSKVEKQKEEFQPFSSSQVDRFTLHAFVISKW